MDQTRLNFFFNYNKKSKLKFFKIKFQNSIFFKNNFINIKNYKLDYKLDKLNRINQNFYKKNLNIQFFIFNKFYLNIFYF